MKRHDLEHIISAAADITGELEIVVIGSQAIHGSVSDPPDNLTRSMEADVFPNRRPDLADTIEGAIGEFSVFHDTNGYYAQAVGPETVKGPRGWEDRLVAVPATTIHSDEARGLCLDAHDLALAKAAAGRERDWEFVENMMRHKLLTPDKLRERLDMMAHLDSLLVAAVRKGIEQRIALTGLK